MRDALARRTPASTSIGALALALLACGGGEPPPAVDDLQGGPASAPGAAAPGDPDPSPNPSDASSPGGSDPSGGAVPAAPPEQDPVEAAPLGPSQDASRGWTTGIVAVEPTVGPGSELPTLTALRTGTHPEYDRLTVELWPDADGGGMPGYHVEYIDRPLHQCGSGDQIHPVGDGWLELRLEPARAHTEAGEPTLSSREVTVEGAVARRLYRTCDFEGVVTLVLAVEAPNPFRVFTLEAPRRIVLDVRR